MMHDPLKIGIFQPPGQKRVVSLPHSDTKQDFLPPRTCCSCPPKTVLSKFTPLGQFFPPILPPRTVFCQCYPPQTVFFTHFTPLGQYILTILPHSDIFSEMLPPLDTFS